jgi:hypothetical protein
MAATQLDFPHLGHHIKVYQACSETEGLHEGFVHGKVTQVCGETQPLFVTQVYAVCPAATVYIFYFDSPILISLEIVCGGILASAFAGGFIENSRMQDYPQSLRLSPR